MARLTRVTAIPFGMSGPTDDFETFGSTAVGSTDFSQDPAAIQATSAWANGWRPALVAAKAPVLQDMNAFCLVDSRQLAYILQEGVAEWDAGTTYNIGSVVKVPYASPYSNPAFFISLANANTGNALPAAPASNAHWQCLFQATNGSGLIIPGTTTNDDAPAGAYGEEVESGIGNTALATSGIWQNLTSIGPLGSGDWRLSGLLGFGLNTAGTLTSCAGAISAFSGNTITDQVSGKNEGATLPPTAITDTSVAIPRWRVKLTTPTTFYLKAQAVFGSGNPNAYGTIVAERPR